MSSRRADSREEGEIEVPQTASPVTPKRPRATASPITPASPVTPRGDRARRRARLHFNSPAPPKATYTLGSVPSWVSPYDAGLVFEEPEDPPSEAAYVPKSTPRTWYDAADEYSRAGTEFRRMNESPYRPDAIYTEGLVGRMDDLAVRLADGAPGGADVASSVAALLRAHRSAAEWHMRGDRRVGAWLEARVSDFLKPLVAHSGTNRTEAATVNLLADVRALHHAADRVDSRDINAFAVAYASLVESLVRAAASEQLFSPDRAGELRDRLLRTWEKRKGTFLRNPQPLIGGFRAAVDAALGELPWVQVRGIAWYYARAREASYPAGAPSPPKK